MSMGKPFRRWGQDEKRLILLWGVVALPELAVLFNRTEEGVRQKARKMKLRYPKESASRLEAKTGVNRETLRRLLVKEGVRATLVKDSRRGTRRSTNRRYDPDDVALAVERWCAKETLGAAARRLETDHHFLKRRLVATGAYRAKHGYRYTEAELQAAMAIKCTQIRNDKGQVTRYEYS